MTMTYKWLIYLNVKEALKTIQNRNIIILKKVQVTK